MAFLTPDDVRYENGVKICEKLIPDTAVWNKTVTIGGYTYRKGTTYKANKKLRKIAGVTIHNTGRVSISKDTTMAEQYTRATWPNCNMGSTRVHYYVDETEAWQNLREDEEGWHAKDGNNGPGNCTTIAIEIIMDGTNADYNKKAEDNGARLCAAILKRHGLDETCIYQHHDWFNKDCPTYIRPHWGDFIAAVKRYLHEGDTPNDDLQEKYELAVSERNEWKGKYERIYADVKALSDKYEHGGE